MAKDYLKGITIVIGADTSGLLTLDKQLKPISDSLRKTTNALKDVRSLMRVNPSNITLWGQKQEYLSRAIQDTKSRLSELESAKRALDEKVKDGVKLTEQEQEEYKALQREIINTKNELNKLEKEYAKGGGGSKIGQGFTIAGAKIKEAGEKVKEFGKEITKIGREFAPVSAAFTLIGRSAIKTNKKWDTAFDNMIAKSGKTGESAQELKDMLKDMYASSAFELTDISDTIGQVSARFKGLSNKEIEQMSDSLLKFQKVTGVDAEKSVDDLGKVMQGFGVEAKDYEKVLDGLVTAQTETGADVEQIMGNMQKYGAALRTVFGTDITTAIGVMASLDKAGVNTTRVVQALQQASTKQLKNMTPEQVKKSFEDLFKTLKGGATNVDEMKKALELMGSRGGLALVDAFQEGQLSWDEMVAAIEGGGTTLEGVFAETYNAEEENRQKIHEMEVAWQELSEEVATGITPAIEWLTGKVQWLKQQWDKLTEGQKKTIITIGLIVAAVAPILLIVGGIISAVGTIITFIGGIISAIGTVIGFLGMVMTPVGWIIAGITAIVALVVIFWDKIKVAFNWIKEKTAPIFNAIKEKLVEWGEKLKEAYDWIKDKISPVLEPVKKVFEGIWDIISWIVEGLGEIFGWLGDIWNWGKEKLSKENKSARQEFEETERTKREQMQMTDAEAAKYYRNLAANSHGQQKLYAEEQAKLHEKAAAAKVDFDTEAAAAEGATSRMLLAFGVAPEEANKTAAKVRENLNKSKQGANAAGVATGNLFGGGFKGSNLLSAVAAKMNEAKEKMKVQGMYGYGKDAGTQWASGLTSSGGAISRAANHLAQLVRERLHFTVPDKGPLSDADTYMPDFINLMVQGINANKGKLLSAVDSLASGVKTELGLNPDVTNTLTNSTIFQPVNTIYVTIGNREIKDYAVEAVTEAVNNKMRAQNLNWGRI